VIAMPSDENNPPDQSKLNKLNRPASNNEPSNQEKTTGNISWRQAMTTVGLALSIPWMIGVPALIGWWVDKRYATAPLWLIVGMVAGLLSTAVNIARLLRRFGQFK
jgi:F0F1-type ATP synthase assembly protein I